MASAVMLVFCLFKSASAERGPENVAVFPIVIPELEFSNTKRQILAADLVIGADNPTPPEALNRVSADPTDQVLLLRMVHATMRELLRRDGAIDIASS